MRQFFKEKSFVNAKFLPQESICTFFHLLHDRKCVWDIVLSIPPPLPLPFPGPLMACLLLSTSAVNQLYPVIQVAFPAIRGTPTARTLTI